MTPVLGGAALTACGSGSTTPTECLTTPTLSRVYEGSPDHKGIVVTIPRLGGRVIGLAIGFRTASGQWRDSDPIPEPFLAQADQRVVLGIESAPVQFRLAEVVQPSGNEYPRLGSARFSAQTTEQAKPWAAVSNKGVLPAWPQVPTTIPEC